MEGSLVRPNIPILSQEETWSRNQIFKNWGNYNVYKFRQGKPSVIIPSCKHPDNSVLLLVYYLSSFIIFLGALSVDLIRPTESAPKLFVRSIILLLNVVAFYLLISTDPGIASISDPVINTAELAGYQK